MGRLSHPVHSRSFLMIGRSSSYLIIGEEGGTNSRGENSLLYTMLADLSKLVLRVSTTVVFTSSARARKINIISSDMRPPLI